MASADTSIFSLRIGGIPLDTFRVIEFQGEEILSQMPRFRILAVEPLRPGLAEVYRKVMAE